jgi:hypothetical protein
MSATVELPDETEDVLTPPEPPPAATEEWSITKNGRQYVGRRDGRSGIVYREGEETIEQARARDSTPKDKRPRRKPKTPKLPPASRKVDLKELEQTLAEALKAPAMLCATFGDEWGAEHFQRAGPYLARNLILASEHNPWLRQKLEEAATGQDAMMMVVSLVGVGGALFVYTVPPVIYFLNLPVPHKTREMFGIPDRKEKPPPYAADQSAETPETAFPAAA